MPASEQAIWLALSELEGWGGTMTRHCELRADLYNLGLQVMAAAGAKIKTRDFRTAEDYLTPPDRKTNPALGADLMKAAGF